MVIYKKFGWLKEKRKFKYKLKKWRGYFFEEFNENINILIRLIF